MKLLPHHSLINFTILAVVLFVAISVVGFSTHQVMQTELTTIQPTTIQHTTTTPSAKQQYIAQLEKKPITIIFGGDVMLARHVQVQQERAGSFIAAWQHIADTFQSADVAVVNLESPFSDQPPYPTEGFVFKAKPENINGLLFAGIDVVTLANNHFANGGVYGMKYTLELLHENNITYVGAGKNELDAYSAKVITVRDKKIAFVAQVYPVGNTAAADTIGMATYNVEKLEQVIAAVRSDVDYVVALFHGGIEYVTYPNQQQKDFAYTAIDAGADVVIGHHPHWVQDTEEYKGKKIYYSLGNLIFDQNWSQKTSEGLVVKMIIDEDEITYEEMLIVIEENYKPVFVEK